MSKNRFVDFERYAKTKWSEVPQFERLTDEAHWAIMFLIKNGFISMSLYNEIEVRKVMDVIKTLRMRVYSRINFYPTGKVVIADNDVGRIEFWLDTFVDDRIDGFWSPHPVFKWTKGDKVKFTGKTGNINTATITNVWSDTCVNLEYSNGSVTQNDASVPLKTSGMTVFFFEPIE